MAAVFARGIIITRTAGNDGSVDGGQGLFYADGHTATGALVVGGLNTASSDARYIGPSAFSSLGPVSALTEERLWHACSMYVSTLI